MALFTSFLPFIFGIIVLISFVPSLGALSLKKYLQNKNDSCVFPPKEIYVDYVNVNESDVHDQATDVDEPRKTSQFEFEFSPSTLNVCSHLQLNSRPTTPYKLFPWNVCVKLYRVINVVCGKSKDQLESLHPSKLKELLSKTDWNVCSEASVDPILNFTQSNLSLCNSECADMTSKLYYVCNLLVAAVVQYRTTNTNNAHSKRHSTTLPSQSASDATAATTATSAEQTTERIVTTEIVPKTSTESRTNGPTISTTTAGSTDIPVKDNATKTEYTDTESDTSYQPSSTTVEKPGTVSSPNGDGDNPEDNTFLDDTSEEDNSDDDDQDKDDKYTDKESDTSYQPTVETAETVSRPNGDSNNSEDKSKTSVKGTSEDDNSEYANNDPDNDNKEVAKPPNVVQDDLSVEQDVPSTDEEEIIPGDGVAHIQNTHQEEEVSSGHFMAYFITAAILCIVAYVLYHNKKKIFAILVEGRRKSSQRRRSAGGNGGGSTAKYSLLESTVEDVMPSLDKSVTTKNYIY